MKYLAKFVTKDNLNISTDFEAENEKQATKIVEEICIAFSCSTLRIIYIYFGKYGKDVESGLIYEFLGNLNQENLPIILAGLK